MAFARPHSTSADGTFSATGAAAWNANQTPIGADVGGIPYCPTATTETTSANLLYTETSGPRLQVGSGSGTSAGWYAGYYGSSGYAALWNTGVTPGLANFTLASASTATVLSSPNSGTVEIQKGGGTRVALFGGTSSGTAAAGAGLTVTAGTATTDVQALSATQTWNAGGVTFTAWKLVVTNTASAAGSLLADLQTAGGGSMFSVRASDGLITTGGTAGVASYGPAAVASITVKNGIITAIS